jgi:hypothetical protein
MIGPLCIAHLVLFCHFQISQKCHALGIFGKLSMTRGAPLSLKLFGTMVWKLLIIEPFSQWKLNKIKIENFIGIWKHSWCSWKALQKPGLIEFISKKSELSCWRYWFLSEFCCWKFKQIAKIGFGRKNQLTPQYVHTAKKFKNSIIKMWKI